MHSLSFCHFFFFNDTATTEIYTLSLHDALPIWFTTLYNFTGGSDGANPTAGVILSNNTLYGTASVGGGSGAGTVFAVNSDGTGFSNLQDRKSPRLNSSHT